MQLNDYRKKYIMTYADLAMRLGFTLNKTYRICQDSECIKLMDAYRIVKTTKGEVFLSDLSPEDCT